MKRLLCIVSSLDTGGAETFLMKLYRKFDTRQHQMDFIVTEGTEGFYEEEVLGRGGKIYRIPLRTKHPLKSFFAIKRIVKNNNYEYVLKLCDTPVGVTDVLAAKLGGATRVSVRSCNAASSESSKRKIINAILRPVLNYCTDIKIAPSDLAANYTFGAKEVSKGRVYFLNNGVDLEQYCYNEVNRIKIREEFNLNDKLVIGHVGRFVQQKNHLFLIDVFRVITTSFPDAVLLLVGNGSMEYQIRERIRSMQLEDKVIFTGVRSDIPAILSAMDVFVFPSLHEGMPNTIIEAQATGLPCVIADTITREADITGLVEYLPLNDVTRWAERALIQMQDERICTKDKFIKSKYDIDSVVDAFVKYVFIE